MNLDALTDRPTVARFPHWVRLDFEREGMSLEHHTNMMATNPER
jgi:hypothetical protein